MRSISRFSRRILPETLLATAALLAALVAPSAAAAAPDPTQQAQRPVSGTSMLTPDVAALSPDPQKALELYWTPERMAASKPLDTSVSAESLRSGTSQTSELGTLVTKGTEPVAATARGKDIGPSPKAGNQGTSWPARHDWVSLTNGKVFFDKADGTTGWQCSGVVVSSEARNTVFTAGHCVNEGDGGAWHNNWTFVPDYYYNDRPLGTWSARPGGLWSLEGWTEDGDNSYDIGAAVMQNNGAGQKLMDVTGSQGIRINGPDEPNVYHFGFPGEPNPPFDGEDLMNCDGPTDRGFFGGDLQMACNMQGGASGGAFLADFNGDSGYTVSVNSYHVGNDLTQIYGPYFGDGAYNLYQAVRNLT
jgi:V8-like Glu-specific endopeptidase